MTDVPPSPWSAAPAALSAFLRGVERRAAVLAELQAGDATAGDAVVIAAMRHFRAEAADLAMSDWPSRFWALLLAEPRLRERTPVSLPLDATDNLGELGGGPRAALLLRLAAGLSEGEAAAALGVPVPAYRLALQRALPHGPDGEPDPLAWQRLREQVQRRIKILSPQRLLALGQARDAVLAGAPETPAAAPARRSKDRPARSWPRRGLLALLWLLLLACAAAFTATFFWPLDRLLGQQFGGVTVRSLAVAEPPLARYGAEAGLISHPDFALLADPEGLAASTDLDFHAWLAGQAPVDPAPSDEAAPVVDGSEPTADAPGETDALL